MNSDRLRQVACLALLPLVAGCASVPSMYEEVGDAKFGEANRQTMMAQVVNPDPVYEGPMVTSGDHAAAAVERYRTDRVKQPKRVSTTSGTGGGGSSSSGSGSSGSGSN